MILVDIGNSGVRTVRFDDDSLSMDHVYRLSWNANLNSRGKSEPKQESHSNQRWCTSLDSSAFDWLVSHYASVPTATWWISSVQQAAFLQLEKAIVKQSHRSSIRKVTFDNIPMKKAVDFPDRTGMDRMLSAWEAWESLQQPNTPKVPVIVAQAGTALTVDCVSSDGTYQGGAIMPGLGLSLQLLAAGTDQLPWLGNHQVTADPPLPGKDTSQAIAAGVHAALAGGARFLVDRYRSNAEWKNATVVVTGGDASILSRYVPPPARCMDHLVLRALYRLAKLNQGTNGY